MSVCLLIVFFQVCDALLASSWLISPFLSSGVLSDLIISRPCGGCDIITYSINFSDLYIIAALKKFLPVDCIVAGLSSLLVVFFVTGLLV